MTTQFTSAQPATEQHGTMMPAALPSTPPAFGRGPVPGGTGAPGTSGGGRTGGRIPGEPVDTSFSP
ncbi:hypothetical protein [Salinifilum ghardaiensis]